MLIFMISWYNKSMRKAKIEDISRISELIDDGSKSLKEDGVDQWQRGVPNRDDVLNDIKLEEGYVFEEEGEVLAYAFLKTGVEESYFPEEDKFLYKGDYITIHRFCVDGKKRNRKIASRFFAEIVEFAKKNEYKALRIDTHRENFRMRSFIEKNKFREAAIVFIDDNNIFKERIAFELLLW